MKDDRRETLIIRIICTPLVIAFASCLPAWSWFGFDDTLAEITGVAALGTVDFFAVWCFVFFMCGCFKAYLHKD
jgi:hypothetical protein